MQSYYKVAIHELFHVLGFSNANYGDFIDSKGTTIPIEKTISYYSNKRGAISLGLISPNVVAFGKKYFGCESLNIIPLENDGDKSSAGSHFERAIFFNEVMTASEIKDAVFSGFSFSVLKDSGWYGINELFVEELQAGKDMGC